jgi:hypothetical protein
MSEAVPLPCDLDACHALLREQAQAIRELQGLREHRLLYRLALGQPNQEDLIEILSSKAGVNAETIRQAVVNLSPWFRKRD